MVIGVRLGMEKLVGIYDPLPEGSRSSMVIC